MPSASYSLLTTLLLVFVAAIAGGVLAKKFKLPTLVGYIGSGLLLGNLLPQLVENNFLTLIADSGVTLLLFALGLEFSLIKLRKTFSSVSWAAMVQIVLSTLLFLFLGLLLGLEFLPAMIIAISAALSSTAVIVKLLSDRGELDTVPGEVATSWAVIQDLMVVPIMLILPVLVKINLQADIQLVNVIGLILLSILKSFLMLLIIFFLGRKAMPAFLGKIAQVSHREVFGLTVVAIVLSSAALTYTLGLSAALGAFLAGLIIAETSQNHAIFAEIRPLRDLFAVVFFVSLGMGLPLVILWSLGRILIVMTLAVVILKWFLVAFLVRFLGYHRKTAFLVGLLLAQMSEFGFIIGQTAFGLGAFSREQAVLLSALVFLTILLTTPLITSGHQLYYLFARTLGRYLPKIFPREANLSAQAEELPFSNHLVICGYGRVGKYIGRALQMEAIPFVVVDYNHEVAQELKSQGIQVVYGDPAEKDVLDYAQVDKARVLVIAIPDRHTQEMVIANAQSLNRRIRIICRTHHEEDQKHLKALGVQTIVQPEFEAAVSIVERLLSDFGQSPEDISGKVSRLKIEHGLG